MNRKKIFIIVFIAVVLFFAAFLAYSCINGDAAANNSSHSFKLVVVDQTGNETTHQLTSSKDNLGDALTELGIIDGEEGPYGLYIKAVDGITADYDKDGTYWAFYIDGEYAQSGVDTTAIVDGSTYMLKVEK